MNIAEFSIKKSVVTVIIIVSMVTIGILTLINLKTELMPNYNFPIARISVTWKGTSPEDMETLVTKKIEDALTSVEGIKKITTSSTLGSSNVKVEFEYGVNIDNKVNDLVTAVSRIRNSLPEDINEPRVRKSSSSNDRVMLLGIKGEDLIQMKSFAENIVIPRLERIEGVGSVDIFGGREKEVQIEIDPVKLEAYGLSIKELYTILKKSSLNFPTGYVREGGREYLVKLSSEVKTVEEIENLLIKNTNGNTIYLKDVADIKIGIKDISSYGRTDGKDNIVLNIQKTDAGNTVSISEDIKEEIKKLEPLLPKNTSFSINRDSAKDIIKSVDTVKGNAITGLVLAGVILFIFLRDWRATLVVVIAIPVSVIATFTFFGAKGMTLNVISLMGLALGVGMLVDNSIVVLDNIYRHLIELKKDRIEAAEKGATEVIIPIIASTATTIAVFFPIVLREGRAKEVYQDMSYSIVFSLLASLIVAITFVPMVSSKMLKSREIAHEDGKILKFVKEKYISILKVSMKNKVKVLMGVLALFIGVVFYGRNFIGGEFMPTTDDGIYSVVGEFPSGLDIDKGNEIARIIEKVIAENSYTKKYTTLVSKEALTINVEVGDKSDRELGVREIMNEVRKKLTSVPDVKLNFVPKLTFGRGSSRDVSVVLKSDDNLQLEYLTNELTKKMRESKSFADINSSLLSGNPEINMVLDREKMSYYGITAEDLTYLTSYLILGGSPIEVKSSREEVDVTVRLKEEYRNSADKLLDLTIKLDSGESIKMKDLVTMEIKEGPYGIDKEDKIKVVTISANLVSGVDLVSGQEEMSAMLEEIGLPSTVTYSFGGEGQSMKEVNEQLTFAFIVSLCLIYFILAAQFESYILPVIVMGTVPLSTIGVYTGLLLTGERTNTMVFVGIIMLAGIVVNNAIVLIDYIKILLGRGINLEEALVEAGKTRLRPILMTTMTTVFGMLPLSLGIGQGSELYKGMAIAVVYGLVFSTCLTLVVIPILFSIYEKYRRKWFGDKN